MITKNVPLVVLVMVLALPSLAQKNGGPMFNTFCTACHTISKGKLIGPDLADVHLRRSDEWLLEFITSSQAMVKKGDPDAVAIYEEFKKTVMPDAPYNADQIKEIIGYIKSKSPSYVPTAGEVQKPAEVISEPPAISVNEATEEQIKNGQLLFSGTNRMSEGGPGCISCHNVKNNKLIGGGLLAKDLTDAYSRMNEAGIKAILTSPPFPAMKEAYQNNPLTEEEAYNLTAFLKFADEEQFGQHARDWQQYFLIAGVLGFVLLMGVFSMTWAYRRKRPINQKIYDRQVYS
jgi:cytochrome c2